ncbi:universal stress protein [Streptomyces sp. V3I7]|uniref:universal stress protein n=1 Tax=Streptomyces sp. V3I7 TaxID=3042278 RepID=UPI00278A2013|nr:universal stress protein [Streptomyces sp. V3I7]MDQ0989169.1 nucleotide-binding universal stress UspA family protein [Streptomyces sp. V3I7]
MDGEVLGPRVVVGVDGSPSSQAALRWAERYAGLVGAEVDAVAVWEVPGQESWSAPAVDADLDEENARAWLTEELAQTLGPESAAPVRALLVRGHPVDVLLRASEEAEVLVVGSHGRGGFARALLGSVSQHVAQHAKCPVVIVRAEQAMS